MKKGGRASRPVRDARVQVKRAVEQASRVGGTGLSARP